MILLQEELVYNYDIHHPKKHPYNNEGGAHAYSYAHQPLFSLHAVNILYETFKLSTI